jgi:hypothetical protein
VLKSPDEFPAKARKSKKVPRIFVWILRGFLWYKDNLTPCYVVKRKALQFPMSDQWMCLSLGPKPQWLAEPINVIRTWKWNAQRIANTYAANYPMYSFTIHRL